MRKRTATRSTYRVFTQAPLAFDGDIEELFERFVKPNLPNRDVVEQHHRTLLHYCSRSNPIFIVRQVTPLTRGQAYVTNAGHLLKPSDNSPAWWMHYFAFNGLPLPELSEIPTRMFEVGKAIPGNISQAGWHIAHLHNAKDRNVDWLNWSRDELQRRFLRNLHPCNCFYIPKVDWRHYGGAPSVIAFFARAYAERYKTTWLEFQSLAGGDRFEELRSGETLRYVYPSTQPNAQGHVPGGSPGGTVDASYSYSRLCFKAAVIEPLDDNQTFEVVTPTLSFAMTKGDFYRDFPGVVRSSSYRKAGIYHFPKVPKFAERYIVNRNAANPGSDE